MHRVGYLIPEGFQVMSLATQTVFEFANIVAGEAVYRIENFSIGGGTVRSSLGMHIDTLTLSAPGLADTWMVAGTLTPLTPPSEEVLASVRGFVDGARRTAGLCTGCFVLAQAGVLDGRRATTHWAYANKLRELHPKIDVEEDRIFIVDGPVWTSAGMTAALDMALGMVEKTWAPTWQGRWRTRWSCTNAALVGNPSIPNCYRSRPSRTVSRARWITPANTSAAR